MLAINAIQATMIGMSGHGSKSVFGFFSVIG
jgi:hypothetical protein